MRISNLFNIIKEKNFKKSESFDALFESFGALSFEKQMNFKNSVNNSRWELDLPGENLIISNDNTYPISFYGSVSKKTNYFLWLWESSFNLNITRSIENSNYILEYGKENNIDEFTQGYFQCDKTKLEKMAMVISHLTNANFYYIGDVNPGSFLVTVNDKSMERDTTESPVKLLNYFPKFIDKFPDIHNHKNALTYYASEKGFEVYERKNQLTLAYYAKYQDIILSDIVFNVEAQFDDNNKFVDIKGTF